MNVYYHIYLNSKVTNDISNLYILYDNMENGFIYGTVLKINSLTKWDSNIEIGNYAPFFTECATIVTDTKIINELDKLIIFK